MPVNDVVKVDQADDLSPRLHDPHASCMDVCLNLVEEVVITDQVAA
jgi:hypothetical protein